MKLPSLLALFALFPFQGAWAEDVSIQGDVPIQRDAPILVELFTSQGCSSCPPAENWLNTRGMELFKQGKIIPLAFHVDYWDYLGWKDPFSSRLFTDRQRFYSSAWGENSIYTPQMVVAGRVGFVGSDGERAIQALSDPANQTAGRISLARLKGMLKITLPRPLNPNEKLYMAVIGNQQVTNVLRGENAGKTLEENFVVTHLQELHSTQVNELSVPVPTGNGIEGMAVFTQDEMNMQITAVGWMGLK